LNDPFFIDAAFPPSDEYALPSYSNTLMYLSAPAVTIMSLLIPTDKSNIDPAGFPFGKIGLIGSVNTFFRTLS
jgi:hypothetical protein